MPKGGSAMIKVTQSVGNTFTLSFTGFETDGDNWIWAEYESTDGGITWSRVQSLSNDNAVKF